jgi:hypothetical protein
MHLVDVVLFLHIAVAIAAFAIAGILHTAQYATRSARTVAELRGWIPVTHRLEPLFPVLALVLFGLGAWLLHLSGGEFRWSDGWVVTAVVTLAVMELLGGAVLAPRGKRLHAVADHAPDGPISPELRAALPDRAHWVVSHLITAIALGVVFLMAAKPNGWQSAVIVAGVGLVGAALGAYGSGVAARVSSPQPQSEPAAAAATP